MKAITTAFGLSRTNPTKGAPWTGHVGNCGVTAIHIGMGPPLTRVAAARLFDATQPDYARVDHVMVAGICGGLDPDLPVTAFDQRRVHHRRRQRNRVPAHPAGG